jgi:hypothetical protein
MVFDSVEVRRSYFEEELGIDFYPNAGFVAHPDGQLTIHVNGTDDMLAVYSKTGWDSARRVPNNEKGN